MQASLTVIHHMALVYSCQPIFSTIVKLLPIDELSACGGSGGAQINMNRHSKILIEIVCRPRCRCAHAITNENMEIISNVT
jgi:hypothetical protein